MEQVKIFVIDDLRKVLNTLLFLNFSSSRSLPKFKYTDDLNCCKKLLLHA